MKYHSSFPAIVISCVMLVMFAAAACGVVLFLSDASPTLSIANEILRQLEEAESPVSVSFSSIDRNLRDGIFINGMRLEGESFSVSFDKLSVRMGLLSLMKYAVTGGSTLSVDAEGSKILISLPSSGGGKSSSSSSLADFSIPSVFSRYNIALHAHDLNVSIPGLLNIADGDIDVAFSDKLSASGRTSSAYLAYNGIEVTLDDLAFDFIDQLRLYSSHCLVNYGGERTEIDALRADVSLDGKLAFSLSGLEGSYGGIDYSLGQSGANYTSSQLSAEFTDLNVAYTGYGISASSALVYIYDMNDVSLFLSGLKAEKDGLKLGETEWLRVNGSMTERRAQLFSPMISTEATRMMTGFISSAYLKTPSVNVRVSDDELGFSFSSSLGITSEREKINGVSADVDLQFGLDLSSSPKVNYLYGTLSNGQFPAFSAPFDMEMTYDGRYSELYFSMGSSLLLSGNASAERLSFSADLNDLRLGELSGIVELFFPQFSNWVGETTSVSGTMGMDISLEDGAPDGPMNLALAVSDVKFNDFHFSFGTSFSAYIHDKLLTVSSAALTTAPLRVAWSGSFDFDRLLPSGKLVLSETESGDEIFMAEMLLTESEYLFLAEIARFKDSFFRGNVDFSENRLITSSAELQLKNAHYPLDLMIDFAGQQVTIDSENVDFDLDFSNGRIEGTLLIDSLPLPAEEGTEPCVIETSVYSLFDFYTQSFTFEAPYVRMLNIGDLPSAPDLSFKVSATNSTVKVDDILFSGDGLNPLNGKMELDLPGNVYVLYLSSDDREEPEELMVSVNKLEDYYSGILRLKSFDLTRFGLESYFADMNLTGRGSQISDLAFSGSLYAWHLDGIRNLNASVFIDMSTVRLTSASFTGTSVSMDIPMIELDAAKGTFALESSAAFVKENMDREYPMKASVSVKAELGEKGTISDIADKYVEGNWRNIKGELTLLDMDIDHNYSVKPVSSSFSIKDGALVFEGDFLDGSYDPQSGAYDLVVDALPIAKAHVDGFIGPGQGLQLHAAVDALDISVVNLLLKKPYVHIHEGTMVHGDIHLINDGDEWDLYGNAEAESAELDVFWLPGSKVVLHNPTFMAWDNLVISNVTDATVVSLTTYEKKPGKIDMALQLQPNFSFDYFEINVSIDDGNEVDFRMPVIAANIDMWGKVSGTLTFHYQNQTSDITGDVTAEDGRFSIGMESLPDWWVPSKKKTVFDFNVLLRENVRIVIPLSSDPILTAYATENQRIRIKRYDDLSIELTGNIGIRSGEFYYISKNFYITEGNVEFQSSPYSDSFLNPVINLRARLRDFDDNGNEVDIYIVLRDATFDNLSPYFESSPAKSTEEIMQILGLAMLPSSVYGDFDLSALIGIVSTSWDVLSHAGIFNFGKSDTFSFEDTVREALNLDTFSLHTKIVTNVIWDTVKTAVTENEYDLSPMARYLDGTSIYLGKYLSSTLYLEGLIHFTAIDNQFERRHTFIADDLNLDVELSLEWDMPIATVKFFTQPMNITFYGLMDAFGFSITKRIVW